MSMDFEGLRVSFTPAAIREHFQGTISPQARVVETASDEDLERVAEAALDNDQLWATFHEVLMEEVERELINEAR